ncbi:MAG TPA: PilZ domain-containing protein [Sphingomicrobium sp.]|nr:PilZ domain-containing protein [Sphingomicrobium sp.]
MESHRVETTHYSMSERMPDRSEIQDGDGLMTLYRVGSLLIGDRRELCLIKKISAAGMMVRTYCTVPEGTCATVELKCGQPVTGKVIWFREPNAGIAFDQPIDVLDILSASLKGPRPRMPRIAIESIVTLRDGASVFRLHGCDISQGGMRLHCEAAIAEGCDVAVTLPWMEPRAAVVRWSRDGQIGLTFNRSLSLSMLVNWLKDQRDRNRAAVQMPARQHSNH